MHPKRANKPSSLSLPSSHSQFPHRSSSSTTALSSTFLLPSTPSHFTPSPSSTSHPFTPLTPSHIALPLSPKPLSPQFSPSPRSSSEHLLRDHPHSRSNSNLGPWLPPKKKSARIGKCALITASLVFGLVLAVGGAVRKGAINSDTVSYTGAKEHVDQLKEAVWEWGNQHLPKVGYGGWNADPGEATKEEVASQEGSVAEGGKESAEAQQVDEDLPPAIEGPLAPIKISPLPLPRLPDLSEEAAETKYIGFLPHSGFHNQRIALQNALLLGKLLNRTVLIPPVWIGWPISTLYYEDLQTAWNTQMQITPASFALSPPSLLDGSSPLFLPANFRSSSAEFPLPGAAEARLARLAKLEKIHAASAEKYKAMSWGVRPDHYPISNRTEKDCKSYSVECRWTYKDTFLSWDFLVDLESVKTEGGVQIVDRWDMRERSLLDLLKVKEEDVYVLQDQQLRDFQFREDFDATPTTPPALVSPNSPKGSFHRTVSIPALSQHPAKVILVGSLFSGGRVHANSREAGKASGVFSRAMAFRNPYLLKPADAIAAKLGGVGTFFGVHARVGDGEFNRKKEENMEGVWRRLVENVLGEVARRDKKVVRDLWEKARAERILQSGGSVHRSRFVRRKAEELGLQDELSPSVDWSFLDEGPADDNEDSHTHTHSRRSFSTFTRMNTRAPLTSLKCRGPLHSDPSLSVLNTPLYLATDARFPLTSPELLPFFSTFPCTFVLSDFSNQKDEINGGDIVEEVGEMMRLENVNDGVGLGRLFLPFLEAIVAAKGSYVVGTPGSTFSAFAECALHDAYMKDIEK